MPSRRPQVGRRCHFHVGVERVTTEIQSGSMSRRASNFATRWHCVLQSVGGMWTERAPGCHKWIKQTGVPVDKWAAAHLKGC